MEELTQYIKADFAVLVAVLYCIGRGLKAIQRFSQSIYPSGTHVLRDWTGLSVGRIALCQLRQLGSRSV